MKKTIVLFFTLCLIHANAFSQLKEAEIKILYPEVYTFEKAAEFENNKEYEKAVWFYINLLPLNKERAVAQTKGIGKILDSVDMHRFILNAFTIYSFNDPVITSFTKGVPNMNIEKLKLKGSWGDALIAEVTGKKKKQDTSAQANSDEAKEYNFRGLDKVKSGDLEGALRDFDQAIGIEPNAQFYFNRAYTKSLLEDFKGAITDYEKTIDKEYRLAEAYFEKGYCNSQLKKNSAAVKDYTKAIKLNDKFADAYNNRALIRLLEKDYKEAMMDLNKAIEINPDFGGAYINRAVVRKESGDTKGCCEDLKRALDLGIKHAGNFLREYCE